LRTLADRSPARGAGALEVPACFRCFAARSPARGSVPVLKRRRDVRGSDVRGSCSCFRLLADSGRWFSDRRVCARLRLRADARSSSMSFRVRRVMERQDRRLGGNIQAAVASSKERALSVEGVLDRGMRRLSRVGEQNDLGCFGSPSTGRPGAMTDRQRRVAGSIDEPNTLRVVSCSGPKLAATA
jgi:hypothetical protein